ncbi:MAG: hypothetical protein PHO41_03165 [Eubacteriales bacterium]|nr:hypothetical protein [Eubacteriales bacterium]
MGAVVWQLNDCWPVASWSSIDYYGRWKALHYYEKRFFAPVLLSCQEEGVLSQETNVNAEGYVPNRRIRLNVSNETPKTFTGTVRWSLRTPDAAILRKGEAAVSVPPYSALWLEEEDCNDADTYGSYCAYALDNEAGKEIASGSVLFCQPKHFRFADPALKAELRGDTVVVSAKAYARSVEVMAGADVLLEDNYFDMNAGERVIKILRGTPETVTVRSVYNIR